jgi:hypothetical protein
MAAFRPDTELEGVEAVLVRRRRKRAASSSGVMSRFIEEA